MRLTSKVLDSATHTLALFSEADPKERNFRIAAMRLRSCCGISNPELIEIEIEGVIPKSKYSIEDLKVLEAKASTSRPLIIPHPEGCLDNALKI